MSEWKPIAEYWSLLGDYEGDPKGPPGCGPEVIILGPDGLEEKATWVGGPWYAYSGWQVFGKGMLNLEFYPKVWKPIPT